VGVYEAARYEGGRGIRANLRLLPNDHGVFETVREATRLKAAGRATPPIGISADWKLLKSPAKPGPDGKARWAVHAITAVNSGDVVIRPSAGGSFDRILEGVRCQVSGVGEGESVDGGGGAADGGPETVGTAAGRTGIGDAAGPDVQRAIDAALLPYKQQLAGAVLDSKLQASGLPAAAQQHVRGQFA